MSVVRKWTACLFPVVAVALTILAAQPAAAASVSVRIDISEQRMHVSVGGRPAYTWKVSTARRGYRTPTGHFRPKRLERTWYSTRYNGSPMPYSIFFYGGYAIHGTYETRNLGRPVSHGCVRLDPQHARTLFDLVLRHGPGSTLITVVR